MGKISYKSLREYEGFCVIVTINQTCTMLCSVGNQDLPCISVPDRFQCIIFFFCFPLLCFPVVTRCSSFSPLKQVAWCLCTLFMSDLVVSASCNTVLYDFFAVHDVLSILCRVTFLLLQFFIVTVLKLSSPRTIHQNGFNIALHGSFSRVHGDFFYLLFISFSEISFFFFACSIPDAI